MDRTQIEVVRPSLVRMEIEEAIMSLTRAAERRRAMGGAHVLSYDGKVLIRADLVGSARVACPRVGLWRRRGCAQPGVGYADFLWAEV